MRVGSHKGLHSGRFKPCLQILDQGGSEWKWQAFKHMAAIAAVKDFIIEAPGALDRIYKTFLLRSLQMIKIS